MNPLNSASSILGTPASSSLTTGKPSAKEQADKAKEEFLNYVQKSPGEKMRDTILGQMGISEADLAGMDDKTREKIEQKIAEMIEEKIKKATEKLSGELPSGTLTSFVA